MDYVLVLFGGTFAYIAGWLMMADHPWISFFTLWFGFFLLTWVVRTA